MGRDQIVYAVVLRCIAEVHEQANRIVLNTFQIVVCPKTDVSLGKRQNQDDSACADCSASDYDIVTSTNSPFVSTRSICDICLIVQNLHRLRHK